MVCHRLPSSEKGGILVPHVESTAKTQDDRFKTYLSGLIAIKLVLQVVKRGKLQYFAAYCLAAGILALILVR